MKGKDVQFFHSIWKWFKKKDKSTFEQYLETFIIIIPIAFVIRTWFYGLYQVPTGSMETTMLVGERFFADKFTVNFRPIKRGDIISFNDPEYDYSDNWFKRQFQMYVWGPANWTKRVIGLPGEHVQGKIEEGKPVVYIDGKKLDEPYLNKYPLLGVYQKPSRPNEAPWIFKSYDPNYSYANQPFYRMDKEDVKLGQQLLKKFGRLPIRYPQTPRFDQFGRNVDIYDIKLDPDEYWVMGDNRLGSYDSRFWGGTGKPLKAELIHGKIVFRIWSLDSDQSWWIFDLLFHPIDFWKRVRWSRCLEVVR